MSYPKGIAVSCAAAEVYVRVVGRGTFQNGQPLRRFALEMVERGAHDFFVDLGQCQGMDSTFLGVLAGIGLRLVQNGGRGKLCVLNVSARNMELLQTLGLDRLFKISVGGDVAGRAPLPADGEFKLLADTDVTHLAKPFNKNDTADLMLEAHDNLIRADSRNVEKFRDLTKFLRDNAQKHATDEQRKT